MDDLNQKIGKNISYFRKKSKLTQSALAKTIGVSNDFLSRVERGYCAISLARLTQVANTLNVPLLNFLDFEQKNEKEKAIESLVSFLSKHPADEIQQVLNVSKVLFVNR